MSTIQGASISSTAKTTPLTRWQLAKWLISRTRTLLLPLLLATTCRVVHQRISIALLALSAASVDTISMDPSLLSVVLPRLLTALIAGTLVRSLLHYLEQYAGHYVAFGALAALRNQFYQALAPQAPAATEGAASGELMERATDDIDRIEVFFAHTLPPAASAIITPVATAIGLAAFGAPTTALVIIALTICALLIRPIVAGKALWKAAQAQTTTSGILAQEISEDIDAAREILLFDAASQRIARLEHLNSRAAETTQRSGALTSIRGLALVLINMSALGIIVFTAPTPTLLAVGAAVVLALVPVLKSVDAFVTDLNASFAATQRIHDVLECPPVVVDPATPRRITSMPRLTFDAVKFGYVPNHPVLHDVTITIEPGSHVAILGVSGSGKSTLTSLALRVWDPDSGSVQLSGTPLHELSLDEIRSVVGVIDQRPFLMPGTIATQLRLGRPEASDAELWKALNVAALDEWVRDQPEQLDFQLAANGANLSGGQQQRLALARGLVAQPKILLLDEVTGALDMATEHIVRQRLITWMTAQPGRAIVDITHRAEQVQDADDIVVLDRGHVIERGDPATLLTNSQSSYARLLKRAEQR